MANVHLISTKVVKPHTTNQGTQRIDLTPWNLQVLFSDYTQRGLLFSKPKELGSDIIKHLQISLSKSLAIFYPFAGRIVRVENGDNTESFYIACDNSSGVKFVHASLDGVGIADIVETDWIPNFLNLFFSMNKVQMREGVSQPLLAVQVTELTDGVFMGFSINNLCADGTSYWDFINTWSEMSSISDSKIGLTKQLVFKSWFLDDIMPPIRIPYSFPKETSVSVFQEMHEKVFIFRRDDIAELKAKANLEMKMDRISSLQAVLAKFWRAVTRHRHLEPNQEISCRIAMNMRHRVEPPLPEEYFGSLVYFVSATTTPANLLENGLGHAALLLNEAVSSQRNLEVNKNLEKWVKSPSLISLGDRRNDDLLVMSSPRFNVYGNDFGWGKPVAVRTGPGNKTNGRLMLFPGTEEGSIEIHVRLSPKTLLGLVTDMDFMKSVSI